MPMLDVFHSDVFGVLSLTTALNKLPYIPSRLGQSGLFRAQGVSTLVVMIEERDGKLALVQTASRGAMPNAATTVARKAKAFRIPHIPMNGAILADDVQGVRAFGSETELETVAGMMNDKLSRMKQDLEATEEWHRIGAIQGVTYDADGTSVIYNWYTEFGITPLAVAFDFTNAQSVKLKAAQVRRRMEDGLGMTTYTGIRAFCGKNVFDSLMTSTEIRNAYDRYQESVFWRENQVRGQFVYGGVTWEEYRGQVGATPFIADSQVRFVPEGVQDLFECYYGPADFVETVNTKGLPMYAKQEEMRFGKGIELHVQTNPLYVCTRPQVLVMGYDQAVGSA